MPSRSARVNGDAHAVFASAISQEAALAIIERREFGISRKTGYKIYSRYREHGLFALSDGSRRPVRYANQCVAIARPLRPDGRESAIGCWYPRWYLKLWQPEITMAYVG